MVRIFLCAALLAASAGPVLAQNAPVSGGAGPGVSSGGAGNTEMNSASGTHPTATTAGGSSSIGETNGRKIPIDTSVSGAGGSSGSNGGK